MFSDYIIPARLIQNPKKVSVEEAKKIQEEFSRQNPELVVYLNKLKEAVDASLETPRI